MGRASLLSMCLNSLYKADVWAYAPGLHSESVHILFSTLSNLVPNVFLNTFNLTCFFFFFFLFF